MTWHILVVDDDATVRGLIVKTLRRRGAEVAEAGGAEAALEQLRHGRFDLLITNLEMPGQSGLWLLAEVRKAWPELPIVVVTGGMPEGWEAAGPPVADAVILKPFRLNELYERVRAVLEGRGSGA